MAEKLGYLYVDTGALYRAIGLYAREQGVPLTDPEVLRPLLQTINLKLGYDQGEQKIFLGERDVSDAIRCPEMGMAAAQVSGIPQVREFLLETQRDLARRCNVVMDGRDIGTVVLPTADVKIFLTAAPEARARRRHKEYLAKGRQISYTEVLEEIRNRDASDSTRSISPLRQAADAVVADTSELNLAQSVELVLQLVKDGIG